MARLYSLVVLMILGVGCQSKLREEAPADLSVRLARVEQSRLRYAPSIADSDNDPVRANTAPPIIEQLDTAEGVQSRRLFKTPADGLETLSLSDLGAPQDAQSAGGGKAETKTTQVETRSTHVSSTERKAHEPPLPNFFDTVQRDLKEMPGDLWRDTKRVYANPVNLAILGAAYGGSLAIQESGPDSTVEHWFNTNNDGQAPRHIMSQGWRNSFGAIGNPGTHFALAGAWYLLGQTTCDDKTYEVGKTLFSALMINGVTVMVGQTASWDRAPNGEWGTFPS
ncbi:MAG TPA: hypothetical protein VMV81_08200, partial [Phycisphaerae bacterium]|nr:hypothetical protein [Phycisphaerae bacterium]